MLVCFASCSFAVALSAAVTIDAAPLPHDVPPVIGTAIASGDQQQVEIRLHCPRILWQKVGRVVPKREWPELRVEVEQQTRTLVFGGPSALAESRVVDLQGNDLRSEEVLSRLETEMPVLVSVSGRMVDPYYLQTTKPDTLIILLGPRDGVPAPALLPRAATQPTPSGIVPAVFDDRPRWRSVIIRRDGQRVRDKLRGVLGVGEG